MAVADPDNQYSRMGRISYLSGHVGFQHVGDTDWSAASVNMPLQIGDRIYTGEGGRAEIQFDDGSTYRLAEKTDIEFLTLNDDLTQIRMLVGLSTLTVNSGIAYEIDTPAAAFTTLQKGKYRFDVAESGDTDGIVRKGLLEASNNAFSSNIKAGELLHIVVGGESSGTISGYRQRDEWDEWNDRRDADIAVYARKSYLPDNVYIGVSELDRYGRWIDSPYGTAWIPLNVGVSWSPYWNGRWCHRPIWGWTWVSYEPWGWLPSHYGRWYYGASFGWCWIPGASISFNFWSPGLVRFYYGPNWISWCPLGPGDYYNVNNYFYHGSNFHHLNKIRLAQNHGPSNLVNRDAPRAFHTVKTDQFVSLSYGSGGANGVEQAAGIDSPWKNGRIVEDKLHVRPTAHSYGPAPDRPSAKPTHELTRPVIVRAEPSIETGSGKNFVRITNRNTGSSSEINQERNDNGNDTRVYRIPQRQSASSTPGEVKGVTNAKESGGQAVQPERNPAGRMNAQAVNRKSSTNKGTTPESEPRSGKSQENTRSGLSISQTSPSGTRSFESSARTPSSTHASSGSYAAGRSTQAQSQSFTMPAQEQRQTWIDGSQNRNGIGFGTQSFAGTQQFSVPNPSYSFSGQANATPSLNSNGISGGAQTSKGSTRSAPANAHSAKTNNSSARSHR